LPIGKCPTCKSEFILTPHHWGASGTAAILVPWHYEPGEDEVTVCAGSQTPATEIRVLA
jgi:hypothetical protein